VRALRCCNAAVGRVLLWLRGTARLRPPPPQARGPAEVRLDGWADMPERQSRDGHSLRILHVSEVHWGGVVGLLEHFVREQPAAGHEVHVLAHAGMPALTGCAQHTWRVDRRRPWTAALAVLDLRRAAHRIRPDVVHLHSFVPGLLGRLPGQREWLGARVPVVYQPHAWSFDRFALPALSGGVRRCESWSAARTDVLVTNCADEAAEGRAIGIRTPAHVLGVPVDVGHFHPVGDAERLRHRHDLGITSRHALVCVGRLSRQKGQDLLLRAWERSRPPETQLILVGPGQAESLRAYAPSAWGRSVTAVGEHADVRPWMWASDAVLLPSRYETVGVVVAEAMACGRPVVATSVNGVGAAIVDGPLPPAGAVVGRADTAALVDQAWRRLKDDDLRRAEGAAGRRRAVRMFSPSQVANLLEQAYRAAIQESLGRNAAS